MADVTDIIDYYVNLLIFQYHDQPKAQGTIRLMADTMLASGIMLDVQEAYNIDTAVGKQLDVIGKYVGVDRYYSEIVYGDYSALVNYSQHASLPTSPPAFGLETYATLVADNDYNGTITYDDIITVTNALSDTDFRTLIKLAILNNNCNYSAGQINANIFSILAGSVIPETNGNMSIQYFFQGSISTLEQAIINKGLLPRPMGVACLAVTGITGLMFALGNYADYESPWGHGCSTYANYVSLSGQTLTYSMIQEA